MRSLLAALAAAAVVTAGVTVTKDADAALYILNLHGRSMKAWTHDGTDSYGNKQWKNFAYVGTNVFLGYNGSASLADASTDSFVRDRVITYCSSGNTCVIHCYSAGCLRMVKAVSDARAMGYTLPGLAWAEASGSAAGGSELAEMATSGLTGFLAKLFGAQEKIDKDITPGGARNTWGYTQGNMGAWVYHTAGYKNTCKKLLFFKICGNKYLKGGRGDGLVAFHSSFGYNQALDYSRGDNSGHYPWRTWDDSFYPTGVDRDHAGVVGAGAKAISDYWYASWNDPNRLWGDATAQTECTGSQCDDRFESVGQNFGLHPNLAVATDDARANQSITTGVTGGSSCAGRCGTVDPSTCSDYASACGGYNATP
jgi:hypothetical protein